MEKFYLWKYTQMFNNVYTLIFTYFLLFLVEASTVFPTDNASPSILGRTAKAKRDDKVEEYDH